MPLMLFLLGAAMIAIAWMPGVSVFFKCIAPAMWAVMSYVMWRTARVLATVSLGEEMLLATLGETSVLVPFRNIGSVEQRYMHAFSAVISIDLHEPTALGTNIKFVPQTKTSTALGMLYLGRMHPTVDELRGLAVQARCA